MSSNEDLADLIVYVQTFLTDNYVAIATFTVFMYDWLLTVPDEVHIMWRRKLNAAKALFFLNRYLFVGLYVAEIVSEFGPGVRDGSCFSMETTSNVFGVLHDLVVSVFQIIRVYAISRCDWRFALLVGVFNAFPFSYAIYLSATGIIVGLPPPLTDCASAYLSGDLIRKLDIVQRVCLVVSDAIIVAVTVHATYDTAKKLREANQPPGYSTMLLHAGILYFGVMLVMNIAGLIANFTTAYAYLSPFVSLFDYILISHFLLNLQGVSNTGNDGTELARPSFVHSIRFADGNVVHSMGGPVRHGSFDDDEDDMDINDDTGAGASAHNDEETPSGTAPGSANDCEESVAGPSSNATVESDDTKTSCLESV